MAGEIKKVLFSEGLNVATPADVPFSLTSVTGILPKANGGTGISSTATFPASGTVAVLTDINTATAGLKPKQSVLVATTANITLSGEQTIDGILTSASRVLVKNQSTTSQNGIYVSAAGAWSRATDFDNMTEIPSSHVFVERGSTKADTGWTCTTDASAVLGTDPITFAQFSGSGSFDSSSPMTTDGDLITRASDAGTRLPVGTNGQVLAVVAGAPAWATNAAVPVTTKGDLFTYDTGAARLPVGVNGQTLQADSTQATGLKWADGSAGGSGELNMVSNPSAASAFTPWAAAGGTWANPSRTTTSGDLPLENQVSTALKIVSPNTALAEATHYVGITMTPGEALKNKKLKVEFYMRPGSNFVASEWTVSVYSGATRMALSTDASGVSYLPNATGKFTTTFDSDASTSYTLRFARPVNAGLVTATLNVTNVIVGPGIQPQGAVVGSPVTFAPVWKGSTTDPVVGNGSLSAFYNRNGSIAEVNIAIQSGTTTTYGSGTFYFTIAGIGTIDTTAMPAISSGITCIGTAFAEDNGGNYYTGDVLYFQSTGRIAVATNSAAGTWSGTSPFTPTAAEASNKYSINFSVPISEWAGSGTVNLAQNDVEYASNSSVSDANDDSSFVYGQSGSVVPSTLTAARRKTVRFQSPYQEGDTLILETKSNASAPWVEFIGDEDQGVSLYSVQNTATYGIAFRYVSGTPYDVAVWFGQYAQANGATFGAAGRNWSGPNGSPMKWRVKRVSGGQAVGFGLATATKSGLVSKESLVDSATTWTANSSSNVSASVAVKIQLVGKLVTIHVPAFDITTNASDVALQSNTAIPSEYRPSSEAWIGGVSNKRAGALTAQGGFLRVKTDGIMNIYLDGTTAAAYAVGTSGTNASFSISYLVA